MRRGASVKVASRVSEMNRLLEMKIPASSNRVCSARGSGVDFGVVCVSTIGVPQLVQKGPDTLVPQLPQNAISFSERLWR